MENARRLLESINKTTDKICRSKMRNECVACFQRGLGVNHEMEKNLLAALLKYRFDTIVAPYEADPQLAYLCHIGYCDGVLSEDSDILVYSAVSGVPFPVLFKFDNRTGAVQCTDLQQCGILGTGSDSSSDSRHSGNELSGIENLEESSFAVGVAESKENKPLTAKRGPGSNAAEKKGSGNFLAQLQAHFKTPAGGSAIDREGNITGRRMFVHLCLLAGCDYSDSIPSVGIQTALQVNYKNIY